MKVKFIKDHISGIGKGSVKKMEEVHGNRLIKEGFAEKTDDKTAYVHKDAYVADPGKTKREKKQKDALEKQKKAKAVRAANRKQ